MFEASTWEGTRDQEGEGVPEHLLMSGWGGKAEPYPAMGVLKTEVPDSTWVSGGLFPPPPLCFYRNHCLDGGLTAK